MKLTERKAAGRIDPADIVDGETLETIVKHFLIAAVWADSEEGTNPRVNRETRADATTFVSAFLADYPALSKAALTCDDYGTHSDAGSPAAAFGHDLYLTARGHGVGFSDREELGAIGSSLSEALRANFRRFYLEPYQVYGWFYLEVSWEMRV